MAHDCGDLVDPVFHQSDHETEDAEDMRSEYMSDRLTIDVDCLSLRSSGCPSMASSFSPMDLPIPAPTTLYSQGSLASPDWPEEGSFPGQNFDAARSSTPLKGGFRLPDLASTDGMQLPYGSVDVQERVPLFDCVPSYGEEVDQFWILSDMPKGYDNGNPFSCQPPMTQYPQMARNCCRNNQTPFLPESASNSCLSQPIFHQQEHLSNSMSMNSIPQWTSSAETISPQTVIPSRAFTDAPVTPPPSYSAFPSPLSSLRTQTPTASMRSSPLTTPSRTDSAMTRVSGSTQDYNEENLQISPELQESFKQRPHRRPSTKKTVKKKPSKHSMKLEDLPSIFKQVQFRCREPGCKGRFKRQEHLKRHMKSHSNERPYVCWVPGCHRAFSRCDNLNAHYTKTHGKRGGRNRYVATLDETSPDYDPDFRGQLTPDGRPIYGSTLDDPMSQSQDADGEAVSR